VTEILNTEIPLTVGKILGASKDISLDLQECLRPRNRSIEGHYVAAGQQREEPQWLQTHQGKDTRWQ
jgi:hypothetical protein